MGGGVGGPGTGWPGPPHPNPAVAKAHTKTIPGPSRRRFPRKPPRPIVFVCVFCRETRALPLIAGSSLVSLKQKLSGKRPEFLVTAWLNTFVSTSYSSARALPSALPPCLLDVNHPRPRYRYLASVILTQREPGTAVSRFVTPAPAHARNNAHERRTVIQLH